MSKVCRVVLIMFTVAYAVAIALYLIGTFGWFGSPKGPLAGIFLVPLALPWSLWLDDLPRPAAAMAAPALNLLILWMLCRWRRRVSGS